MPVVIKDFELPKSCDICPFCNEMPEDGTGETKYECEMCVADCYGEDVTDYIAARHEDCPLSNDWRGYE